MGLNAAQIISDLAQSKRFLLDSLTYFREWTEHSACGSKYTARFENGLIIGWPLSRPLKYIPVMLPAAHPCAATPRKRSPNTHP